MRYALIFLPGIIISALLTMKFGLPLLWLLG